MSGISLRFAPEAQDDINQIQQYTYDTFGLDQLDAYEAQLYDAFDRIREHPLIGREGEDGVRELVLRHHVVLHEFDGETVMRSRVMHPRRFRG